MAKTRFCLSCGGKVEYRAQDGVFLLWRGVDINFPRHIPLPRCAACLEINALPEEDKEIDRVLEEEYQKHKDLIDMAKERFRRKQEAAKKPK